MKTIAVYGSLKKGLHNDWGTRDGKFLGTVITSGEMYSVGTYPVLMENGKKQYEMELYDISEEMYKQIHRMEIGAGYIAKEIEILQTKATIFYGDPTYFTNQKLANLRAVNEWPPIN
jgi:gamma-glutamylcyclotransferase (GGCT)/AIG2-like uncharacterized protein YtfP